MQRPRGAGPLCSLVRWLSWPHGPLPGTPALWGGGLGRQGKRGRSVPGPPRLPADPSAPLLPAWPGPQHLLALFVLAARELGVKPKAQERQRPLPGFWSVSSLNPNQFSVKSCIFPALKAKPTWQTCPVSASPGRTSLLPQPRGPDGPGTRPLPATAEPPLALPRWPWSGRPWSAGRGQGSAEPGLRSCKAHPQAPEPALPQRTNAHQHTGHLPAQVTALIKDLGTYLSPQLPPGGKVSEQGERPAPQGSELRPPTSETLAELPWRVLLGGGSRPEQGVARRQRR